MLPEEIELARLETDQTQLREQVTSAELALQTIKTQTAQFQHRYYQIVGRLYAQLDDLDAQIARLLVEQTPDDDALKSRSRAAEQRAKTSAEEAGLIDAQPKPPPEIAPSLKQAYRQAVKLMHPDLATTEIERLRRTQLMALINLAYEQGDQAAIEKLIEEFGRDPEAIVGEDTASRIVKSIRRIAQLRRRLDELEAEVEAQKKTELFRLKQTTEEAEARGDNPLGDLSRQLTREISEREARLKVLRQRAAAPRREHRTGKRR